MRTYGLYIEALRQTARQAEALGEHAQAMRRRCPVLWAEASQAAQSWPLTGRAELLVIYAIALRLGGCIDRREWARLCMPWFALVGATAYGGKNEHSEAAQGRIARIRAYDVAGYRRRPASQSRDQDAGGKGDPWGTKPRRQAVRAATRQAEGPSGEADAG